MSALTLLAPSRFWRVFLSDAKNVRRDPTLLAATLMSQLPAPAVAFWTGEFDKLAMLIPGNPPLGTYAAVISIVLPAFLIGWVTGFLMLEDRDDGPLMALDVSPPGKGGFLVYRLVATVVICVALTYFSAAFVLPQVSPALTGVIGIFVALEAAAVAITYPALARNKVEGLALTKLLNILSFLPVLAAAPSAWRFVAGVIPPFWVGEIAGLSGARALPPVMSIPIALAVHLGVLFLLYRLLQSRAG